MVRTPSSSLPLLQRALSPFGAPLVALAGESEVSGQSGGQGTAPGAVSAIPQAAARIFLVRRPRRGRGLSQGRRRQEFLLPSPRMLRTLQPDRPIAVEEVLYGRLPLGFASRAAPRGALGQAEQGLRRFSHRHRPPRRIAVCAVLETSAGEAIVADEHRPAKEATGSRRRDGEEALLRNPVAASTECCHRGGVALLAFAQIRRVPVRSVCHSMPFPV